MVLNLNQAARSLRNCPVTYTHPSELLCLEGIGPKTVDALTRRLKEWCLANREDMREARSFFLCSYSESSTLELKLLALSSPAAQPRKATAAKAKPNNGKVTAAMKRKAAEEEEETENDRIRAEKRDRVLKNSAPSGINFTGGVGAFDQAAADKIEREQNVRAVAAGAGNARGMGGIGGMGGGGGGGDGWGRGNVLGGAVPPPAAAGKATGKKRALVDRSDDENDDDDEAPSPVKRKNSTKAYVPRKGSGAYAILIALYLHIPAHAPSEWSNTWKTNPEIVRLAAPYSNTSFEVPGGAPAERGQGAYTAWKSMKTLVDKDLVKTDNKRPKRWVLTRVGYELADTLAGMEGLDRHDKALLKEDGFERAEVPQQKAKKQKTAEAGGARASGTGSGGGGRNPKADHDPSAWMDDEDEDEDEDTPIIPRQQAQARPRPAVEEDEEARFQREIEEALALSIVEAKPPRRALPLPAPLPKPKPKELEPLLSSSNRSSGMGSSGLGGPREAHLDGRKAASGAYARNIIDKPVEVNLGVGK